MQRRSRGRTGPQSTTLQGMVPVCIRARWGEAGITGGGGSKHRCKPRFVSSIGWLPWRRRQWGQTRRRRSGGRSRARGGRHHRRRSRSLKVENGRKHGTSAPNRRMLSACRRRYPPAPVCAHPAQSSQNGVNQAKKSRTRALVRGALGRARLLGHIVPDKVLLRASSVAAAVTEVSGVPYGEEEEEGDQE